MLDKTVWSIVQFEKVDQVETTLFNILKSTWENVPDSLDVKRNHLPSNCLLYDGNVVKSIKRNIFLSLTLWNIVQATISRRLHIPIAFLPKLPSWWRTTICSIVWLSTHCLLSKVHRPRVSHLYWNWSIYFLIMIFWQIELITY